MMIPMRVAQTTLLEAGARCVLRNRERISLKVVFSATSMWAWERSVTYDKWNEQVLWIGSERLFPVKKTVQHPSLKFHCSRETDHIGVP
jgi:hypothetical protein